MKGVPVPRLWESTIESSHDVGAVVNVLLVMTLVFAATAGALAWGLLALRKKESASNPALGPALWNLGDVTAVFSLGGGLAVILVIPELMAAYLQSGSFDALPPASLGRMILTQDLALGLTCLLWLRVRRRVGWESLGLVTRDWKKHGFTGLKAGILLWLFAELMQMGVIHPVFRLLLGPQMFNQLAEMNSSTAMLRSAAATMSPGMAIGMLILVGLFAPFAEEILFRGFAYPPMKRALGIRLGLVLCGAFFAALHFSPLDFPVLCLVGIFLAWLYDETGTITTPFVAHATNNVITVILLLAFPRTNL